MSKTIKQIADELGVSKQAVQKRISKEPLYTSIQQYVAMVAGTKYIEEIGEILIKRAFNKSDRQQVADNQPTTKKQNSTAFLAKNRLEILEKEVQVKNEQITELNRCIDTILEQGTHITEMFLEAKKTIAKQENELLKEKEHSRQQSDKITQLANKLSQLADQSQQLQLAQLQQQKSIPVMTEKLTLWQQLFKKVRK